MPEVGTRCVGGLRVGRYSRLSGWADLLLTEGMSGLVSGGGILGVDRPSSGPGERSSVAAAVLGSTPVRVRQLPLLACLSLPCIWVLVCCLATQSDEVRGSSVFGLVGRSRRCSVVGLSYSGARAVSAVFLCCRCLAAGA